MANNTLKGTKSGFKWNIFSSFISILIRILRGFVVPKLLGAAAYGLFSSVGYYTRWLQFADFGAQQYFNKVFPNLYFNSTKEEQQEFTSEIFSFILLTFILVFIYLGALAFFYRGENHVFYIQAFIILIPVTIFAKVREMLSSYALCTQNYKLSSLVVVFEQIIGLILVIVGVYYYGAIGGVLSLAAVEVLLLMYILSRVKMDFNIKLHFSSKIFKTHYKGILKLFIISIGDLLLSSIEYIFILNTFGHVVFGVFSFGLAFTAPMLTLASIFVNALHPKIMSLAKSNKQELFKILHNSIFFYYLLCAAMIPPIVSTVNILLKLYFQDFASGGEFFYLLFITSAIRGMLPILKQYYIAINQEVKYIRFSFGLIGILTLSFGFMYLKNVDVINALYFNTVVFVMIFFFLYYKIAPHTANGDKKIFTRNIVLILVSVVNVLLIQLCSINLNVSDIESLVYLGVLNLVSVAIWGVFYYVKRKDLKTIID